MPESVTPEVELKKPKENEETNPTNVVITEKLEQKEEDEFSYDSILFWGLDPEKYGHLFEEDVVGRKRNVESQIAIEPAEPTPDSEKSPTEETTTP